MKIWQLAPVLCGLVIFPSSFARAAPESTAIFPFTLDDTSLQGEMQGRDSADQQRLARLDTQLKELLIHSGCCAPVSLAPVASQLQASNLQACGNCAVDFARKAGAQLAVTGWVQKVSSLILNINLVIRDVSTGKMLSAGSVDIRGDTDESWSRGLAYLMRDRLMASNWPPKP
jgi:Protein of unknown function (DUF2380)